MKVSYLFTLMIIFAMIVYLPQLAYAWMIFLSCPPVYTLPGTWSECRHALIPHMELEIGPMASVFLGLLTLGLMLYSTKANKPKKD